MSADNWGECPRCRAVAQAKRIQLKQRLETDYGKIPLKEYKELEAEYTGTSEYPEKMTLREDYEFWLNEDAVFTADYSAMCTECDFKFTFTHTEDVEV